MGQQAGVANPYRIQKHDLVNKNVLIIRGQFKGQRGRVTHVNGEIAEIEMSIRAKKVNLSVHDVEKWRDDDGYHQGNQGHNNNPRNGGNQ